MDSQGFRLPQGPRLYMTPRPWEIEKYGKVEVTPEVKTLPTEDNRYPAFAGPMSDARLITDYRSHCQTRSPYGNQNAVKAWMVHNAEDIMDLSRRRQVEYTGHIYGVMDFQPTPQVSQTCSVNGCTMEKVDPYGWGSVRETGSVPELFGAFQYSPNAQQIAANKSYTRLTRKYEFGRNTAHRWENLLSETMG